MGAAPNARWRSGASAGGNVGDPDSFVDQPAEPRPVTRRAVGRCLLVGSVAVGVAPGGAALAARPRDRPAGQAGVTGRSPWRRLGDTSAATFRAEFDRFGSPMLPEAEAIRGEVEGFSRLYLAMAFMETKYATHQESIPAARHNALAIRSAGSAGGWDRYPSFRAGARAWLRLLTAPDGPYAEAETLRELIAIYAPRADKNQVTRYVATVVAQIEGFPLETVRASEPEREREPERQRRRSSGERESPKKGSILSRRVRLAKERLAQERLAAGEAGDRVVVEEDA